jgi:hypothetical protein
MTTDLTVATLAILLVASHLDVRVCFVPLYQRVAQQRGGPAGCVRGSMRLRGGNPAQTFTSLLKVVEPETCDLTFYVQLIPKDERQEQQSVRVRCATLGFALRALYALTRLLTCAGGASRVRCGGTEGRGLPARPVGQR